MSFTTTTNYNLVKPDIDSEIDTWGTDLNANSDSLDAIITALNNRVAALEASTQTLVWQ